MPLYNFRCEEDHTEEHYVHVADDLGCATHTCRECRKAGDERTLTPVPSFGIGLTWAEEGRPRTLWNLGPKPITVTSHEQHKREMKKAGVEWATGWNVNKTKGWV